MRTIWRHIWWCDKSDRSDASFFWAMHLIFLGLAAFVCLISDSLIAMAVCFFLLSATLNVTIGHKRWKEDREFQKSLAAARALSEQVIKEMYERGMTEIEQHLLKESFK